MSLHGKARLGTSKTIREGTATFLETAMEDKAMMDWYMAGLRLGYKLGWSEARTWWLLHEDVPKERPEDKKIPEVESN